MRQKDVMHKLQRDGKLCDSAEDWETWFRLSYPDCGEDEKWVAILKMTVKLERRTYVY